MANLMAGKVVVVTGGASGIGRATAVAFAREGARVVIGDIDNAGAEKTVASIRNNGGEASCVRVDVTKPADVQQMITSAVTQYGGLDYAFNNAGLRRVERWCRGDERRGLAPRYGDQPDGRLALHEIRNSRDVKARRGCDRE